MAVMVIFHGPEMTKDQYEALRPVVQWESNHPQGVLLHSCAFDEQGGLHVVDLWDSPENLMNFVETRLKPGFAQVGITHPPTPQVYPVHNANAYPGLDQHRV